MDSSGLRIEHLTRRENDILILLGQNLSDREIAERLVLSLHSVKWYNRQVYAKLGVSNRQEAVARAHALGLLPRETSAGKAAHNLPRQLSSFIGREKEIDQVVRMAWEYPLVTLTGAGGVGKTRLSQVVARELLDDFADGVWYVELAALADPQRLVPTLADGIGIREEPNRPLLETIFSFFYDRQALLVLDNCEHVIMASAKLAQDLLSHLPRLKIITTSRVPLGINGEALFRVPSLTFPSERQAQEAPDFLAFEAVRLFVERARAARHDFQLTPANTLPVVQICQRLDGIPLAIELAAARARMLSVEQIAARLDRAFDLLTGGSRVELPRHQTLKAMIDWSYDLLSPAERTLLQRLSVFAGGWTLEAAESVCADDGDVSQPGPLQANQVIDLLGGLIDKSLVQFEPASGAEPRYRMLVTVRQYAAERLAESGAGGALRERHLDYFLSLGLQAEPHLRTPQAKSWMNRLDQELDNLHQALAYALMIPRQPSAGLITKGLRLAAGLYWFWWARSHQMEGIDWLERLLREQEERETIQSPDLAARVARGRALNVLSRLIKISFVNLGTFPHRLVHLRKTLDQESLAIFSALGETFQRDFAISRFNQAETVDDFLECRKLFRSIHDPFWVAECDFCLIRLFAPDDERVFLYGEENLALRKEIGDLNGEASALFELGYFELCRSNLDRSVALTLEALSCFETAGDRVSAASVLSNLAMHFTSRGDFQHAIHYSERLRVIAHELNNQTLYLQYMLWQAYFALAHRDYDQAIRFCEKALELSEEFPHEMRTTALYLFSRACLSQGKRIQARTYLKELIKPEIFWVNWDNSFRTIHALGIMAVQEGHMQRAATWFGAQDGIFGRHDWLMRNLTHVEREEFEQALAVARTALGEAAFTAAWEAGRAMSVEQVVKMAQESFA